MKGVRLLQRDPSDGVFPENFPISAHFGQINQPLGLIDQSLTLRQPLDLHRVGGYREVPVWAIPRCAVISGLLPRPAP